jgi:endonuclease-3
VVYENNKRREGFISRKKKQKTFDKKNANCTPVTDAIISTMLSQNTTDANQKRAFAGLKEAFSGGWEEVANTKDTAHIEDAIRVAGLAKIRAERIQSMLQIVREERGEANFEYLQNFNSTDEIQKELSRFKGMGPKTISCVCLFAFGIPEFPVDTHVLRISQKLGWVSASTSREAAYEYLNERVPEEYKLDLHCLLVKHGKYCYNCAANGKPQFKPKEKWICPLIVMKSDKMDMTPKIEKQVKVKSER